MDVPLAVDRSSPVPLYHQVAIQLEAAIANGAIPPGERIGNEVALAARLGLSRPTVRQAIQTLVDRGILVRKRGVGTQVVHGHIRRSVELTSLWDDLQRDRHVAATRVLSCEYLEADADTAEAMRLPPGTGVWSLRRVRFVDGEPLAVLQNCVPVEVVDLAAVDLSTTGLYQALRAAGVHMRVARQEIGARGADPAEASLLQLRRGAPVLTMRRTAFDDAGRTVELGRHAYRPDLYSFEMTLVDR